MKCFKEDGDQTADRALKGEYCYYNKMNKEDMEEL
jgi:hypothetical protein